MTLLPQKNEESQPFTVNKGHFTVTADHVSLQVNQPLKTISSAVVNAGLGWYRSFVNRHVDAELQLR